MSSLTVGFVGLGLIGGSVARALKKANPETVIMAYDRDTEALAEAYEDGTADILLSGIDSRYSDCDIIFLCAPVSANMELAAQVAPFMNRRCILTDVGSVKGRMHRRIGELGLSARFIGGHPMAGSERTGYRNSKAMLLENAYYIITPTPDTAPEDLEHFRSLVSSMGAIPMVMAPEEHDRIAAAVSHLPHVISAALVNLVKGSDSENGRMRTVAAGGFKDITRISSSSPEMWQSICAENSENISRLLALYIRDLEKAKALIDARDRDGLRAMFDSAKRYRETFPSSSAGPIKTDNAIHVEIADRPGSLAVVMTMLAAASVDIKNVGIVHNREFESGSLRIELHSERDVKKASGILRGFGYPVTVG
ncbi:prephenate dehydrogenase [Candidatus Methanomethylophilus sp. 1R26]|uniref:prephenate dehydrogenase n=1 Tax=Candidatus Methanomethylophilus sp. 1R26 TaxID=1769296 RepID=UPI00073613B5|nr:prephenate dehydrogenase [Candidatus Methanomethylophilus sp. 1R26]KUE73191.1 prephenate dehydrogenase [Candidatus Methanomethylophilus sp. 1R26]